MTERQAIDFATTSVVLYYLDCQMWVFRVRKGYIASIATMVDTVPTFTVEDVETGEQTELLAVDLLETEAEAEVARKIAQEKCNKEMPIEVQKDIIFALAQNGIIK